MESSYLMNMESQFEKMKKVLKMNGGDGCITVWTSEYLMPLNCSPKNCWNDKCYVM